MSRYIATMTFEVFAADDRSALAIAEHFAKMQDKEQDDRSAIRELHRCPVGSLEEHPIDITAIRENR
jgi:hypothetical protein